MSVASKKKRGGAAAAAARGDATNSHASAMAALTTELDRASTGSESEEGVTQAIEEAMTDDKEDLFDEQPRAPADALSAEERAEIEQELKKTEDEIQTLRQVLAARMKHASELKHKLGLSPWSELTHDMSEGLRNVKETTAYQRTTEIVSQTTDVVKDKFDALRQSNAYKSFEERVGSALGTVKSKISGSTSIGNLYGNSTPSATGGATTQPPTPMTDRPPHM